MKRPLGVILTCVVLGILAVGELIGALFIAFAGIMMRNGFPTTTATGAPAPPPGFMTAFFLVFAFFCLVLGVWTTATVVGLAKLRNWARYSVMVAGRGPPACPGERRAGPPPG